jgi:hypothetical protein
MVQVAKYLPSKDVALSSNPSVSKRKKEMNKFLGVYDLPKLNQEVINNLNRSKASN